MDGRLYDLWLEHIKHGFENNNIMFNLRCFLYGAVLHDDCDVCGDVRRCIGLLSRRRGLVLRGRN